MSRLSELLRNTPTATLGIILLCTLLHTLHLLTGFPLAKFTFCPMLILYSSQYYRIITSVLLHGSVMHFVMNMVSTYAIGVRLERRMGTVQLLWVVILSIWVTAAIHIFLAVVALVAFQKETLMAGQSIGFSGVLFHLSVLECRYDEQVERNRSVFGIFSVPTAAYPWVLLIVLQLFIPNLSFIGHLSGILAGTVQVRGCWNCLYGKNLHTLQRIDSSCAFLANGHSGYVPTPQNGAFDYYYSAPHSLATNYLYGRFMSLVMNVYETLGAMIYQNNVVAVDDDDASDGWNGLPDEDDEQLVQQLV